MGNSLTILCSKRQKGNIKQDTWQSMLSLTTPTRVHLTIWAKLDAMNWTMVSFEYFSFLSIDAMNPDPLICRAASDKSILENRVDGC